MNEANDKYQSIAERLAAVGWIVVPDFVNEELARSLRVEALNSYRNGAFHAAGVGQGEQRKLVAEIRSDQVLWLNEPYSDAQTRYLAELEQLRLAVNRTLFLGLWDFEGHYAVYEPGSRYARHLDQFSYAKQRRVTCITYLNETWRDEDGGQLRIHLNGELNGEINVEIGGDKENSSLDVLPQSGTLVCFLSERFYHEVLPSTRERVSVTGWFRVRE